MAKDLLADLHCRQVNFENMSAALIFTTKSTKSSKLYAKPTT